MAADPPRVMVTAVTETEPVDADPDDPAIWINTDNPAQSRVIGTDKQYGLLVFDLDGKIVQRLPDGKLNNVDIRQDVDLGGSKVTLVAASKREDNTIVLYTVAADGTLQHATPFAFPGALRDIEDDIYGIGLHVAADGIPQVIVNFKTGDVVQWAVAADATGQLSLTLLREWTVPSQPEGIVADDELGFIYVGEENGGIWRFEADPQKPAEGVQIDLVGSACLATDDVEGLTIYKTGPQTGYLVASSQGDNSYALYERQPNEAGEQSCIGSFSIGTGATDPVGETDGLDVTALPLGPLYPQGLLAVQDDRNEGFTRNFKFVSWQEVTKALNLGIAE
ncbi:MAG: phytase [Alphaproteobacteria bacterium]|nr:phytase [Alphaproteobacteria bacterium]